MDLDPRRRFVHLHNGFAHLVDDRICIEVVKLHLFTGEDDQLRIEYIHQVGKPHGEHPARPVNDISRRAVPGPRRCQNLRYCLGGRAFGIYIEHGRGVAHQSIVGHVSLKTSTLSAAA